MEFFDDILVTPDLMFENSTLWVSYLVVRFIKNQRCGPITNISYSSDHAEQCWIWENDGQRFYYDKLEWVRIRVESEQWHDNAPLAPPVAVRPGDEPLIEGKKESPYSIIVCRERLLLSVLLLIYTGIHAAGRSRACTVVGVNYTCRDDC